MKQEIPWRKEDSQMVWSLILIFAMGFWMAVFWSVSIDKAAEVMKAREAMRTWKEGVR